MTKLSLDIDFLSTKAELTIQSNQACVEIINDIEAPQFMKARALASLGFKVYPLCANSKVPVHKNPTASASNKLREVKKMFTNEAGEDMGYNIGIALENDFVVVDLDNKNGVNGIEEFAQLSGKNHTRSKFEVKTPNGGIHYYYRNDYFPSGKNSGIRNSVSKLAPGIDTRGLDSTIVAPGSVINGVPYKLEYDGRQMTSIRNVYKNVICSLGIADVEEYHANNERQEDDFDYVDSKECVDQAINFLIHKDGAEEGSLSNTLYSVACSVRDFGVSRETAIDLIETYYLDKCEGGDISDWFTQPVDSAYKYSKSAMGSKSVLSDFEGLSYDNSLLFPVNEKSLDDLDASPLNEDETNDDREHDFDGVDISFTSLLDNLEDAPLIEEQPSSEDKGWSFGNLKPIHAIPQRPWLIQDLLMSGDVTTLSANGAGGKTTMLLGIAVGLASGSKEIYGYENRCAGKPVKSLIHSAEDSIDELSRRIHGYCVEHKIDPDSVKNHIALSSGKDRKLTFGLIVDNRFVEGTKAIMSILELVRDNEGIGFIGLDPLSNLHECVENDSIQMTALMSVFNKLAAKTGAGVMVMHHTTKAGDGSVFATRGSGAIINSSRVALVLNGLTPDKAKECGIDDTEYVRVSYIAEGKSNMSEKKGNVRYFFMKSVIIGNGDSVGVHTPYDIDAKRDAENLSIANDIKNHILKKNVSELPLTEIVKHLKVTVLKCKKQTQNEVYSTLIDLIDRTGKRIIDFNEDASMVVAKEEVIYDNYIKAPILEE